MLQSALFGGRLQYEKERSYENGYLCQEGWCTFLIDLQQFMTHLSQTAIILLADIYMKFVEKKEFKYALGAISLGALLFGLFKAYKSWTTEVHGSSNISSNFADRDEEEQRQTLSFASRVNEHIPYEALIEDLFKDKLRKGCIQFLPYLHDISYRIILSLMKGNSYQGIVNLSFVLDVLPDDMESFPVNFNGGGIKYVMVNGKAMDHKDVRYTKHQILIPKALLKQKSKNNIQVIFQNLYSFLDQGLSAYFMVDQNHKYSLRQQVIYSVNGYLQIERIIPCLNCFNECRLQLEVIHPDTFQVFSNKSKSLERLCSINQYQKYPFLFDLSSSALNKSFKLSESTISNYSGIGESTGYSTTIYYNRKKANTHFYPQKLPSIHHMFIFSSSMIELQPNSMNNPLESELLIRYFCKHTESHKLAKNINKVHNYILDIFRRLNSQNIKGYINKIDILVVADKQIQGYFAPGVIILSEQSLRETSIDIRCFYLIVRALMGLLQIEKGFNVLTLRQILSLNETVFSRFQEFRNYLFLKNQKYQKIRKLIINPEKKAFLMKYEGYFLKYYSKQLRFILKQDIQNKISFQLNNLMLSFNKQMPEQFWQNFLSNYNFLSPLIIQPLIKLGIRKINLPNQPKLLEHLKSCFNNSKYILSFYTNDEIAEGLPKFIELGSYGLEQRLTQIKVKLKFKDFITQKYEKYLPIRSNQVEAESMYLQFKRFNERKNFHHVSILKTEIKRVSYFGKNFVAADRVVVDCSIMGWKLLNRLQIYPQQDEYYFLILNFQGLA